ncbi:MAG: hypothetical protein PHD83_01375 [Caldisericia bacterium]|nr:hypothetical protein [Caldisericia bacterium]
MKEPWYEQWWFLLLMVVITVVVIVNVNKKKVETSIKDSISKSVSYKYSPEIGDVIMIGLKEAGGGIIARNPLYLNEYIEADKANDTTRQAKLEDADKVFILKQYTVALVIDIYPDLGIVKVRILEGQHYGEAAYTLDIYCKIKKTILE